MNRKELTAIVRKSNADTLIASKFRAALGIPQPHHRGRVRDRDGKHRRYRGARKLMAQKHGVRL